MELFIYDQITNAMALKVAQALRAKPREAVTVYVNSYGGDLAAGLAMLNALRSHQGAVSVSIEGVAASAASLFCCVGTVRMADNAALMIHQPWIQTYGTAKDLRNEVECLERHIKAIVTAYVTRTRKSADQFHRMFESGDTWFNATEALAFGFIDEIAPAIRVAACLGPLKLPERFLSMPEFTTPTTMPAVAEIQNTAPVYMSAAAIAAMCEHEPGVITSLLAQPRTEADVRARLAQAKSVRAVCASVGMHALADKLVVEGATKDGAMMATWQVLAARSQENQIDTTPPVGNPRAYGGYGGSFFLSAASDALAVRMGATPKDLHPAAPDFQDTSLTGMAAACLNAAGHYTLGMTRQRIVKMAMTTTDFPELLSVTANKSLTARFEDMAEDHRQFCESSTLPDFKPASAVNVSLLPGLVLKPEAAEIQYGSLSDGAETYKLATYARGLSLSREAIINDDLQAFSSLIAAAANASARLERDLVFNALIANAAMSDGVALFHASHKNMGAITTGLDVAGLNAARVLMRQQKDSNGGFVMTQPRFIICPVSLQGDAEALLASVTYRPATDTEISTPKWIKGLIVVSDPRLDAVSDTDWYLLSHPISAPTIRLGYLNNVTTPTVEDDKDFDTDVFKYKIRFDVVAAVVGYAGAVKMTL